MLTENNLRGGFLSVMGDRFKKSNDNKKILDIEPNNLFGYAMSQWLPYDEIEMWKGRHSCFMDKLEDSLNTPDDSDMGYLFEVDSRYPDEIKEKTKKLPFAPESKKNNFVNFFPNMI